MSTPDATPLPAALCEEVGRMLTERYGPWLREGEHTGVEGKQGKDELELSLFVERGEGEERWEVTVRLAPEGRDEEEVLSIALDAADAVLAGWLEEDRARKPPEFEEAQYEGETLGLRYRRWSPRLEEEGDVLLKGGA
ncbi:MAG: hypothetical protein P1V51_24405 [Deltaproteobacteria bacterium]|nr:hypothetical protein [Deltaproteobacteria bacterium]